MPLSLSSSIWVRLLIKLEFSYGIRPSHKAPDKQRDRSSSGWVVSEQADDQGRRPSELVWKLYVAFVLVITTASGGQSIFLHVRLIIKSYDHNYSVVNGPRLTGCCAGAGVVSYIGTHHGATARVRIMGKQAIAR